MACPHDPTSSCCVQAAFESGGQTHGIPLDDWPARPCEEVLADPSCDVLADWDPDGDGIPELCPEAIGG